MACPGLRPLELDSEEHNSSAFWVGLLYCQVSCLNDGDGAPNTHSDDIRVSRDGKGPDVLGNHKHTMATFNNCLK